MSIIKSKMVFLVLLIGAFLSGCSSTEKGITNNNYEKIENNKNSICMITDSGNINDESFNQTTYEACRDFALENSLVFACKKPDANSDEERNKMVEIAAAEGYEILVMSGYQLAPTVLYAANNYPDLKIIGIDIGKNDLLEAALGSDYSYDAQEYELSDYINTENIYCVTFKEEQAGFLAGYMAVKTGFEKLGFMGGVECAAVSNYGYGFVQGADYAAKELGKYDRVAVEYYYSGTFSPSPEVKEYSAKMYKNGCEVIFACGGGICNSIAQSCYQCDKRIIGVDVDQKGLFDRYAEGIVLTSAVKGLRQVVYSTLGDIVENKWQNRTGNLERLGIVSDMSISANFVQLSQSTEFDENFSKQDYQKLISDIYNKSIIITSVEDLRPEVQITVDYLNDMEE